MSVLTWQFLNVFLLPIVAIAPLFLRWALHSRWSRIALLTSALVLCALLVDVHWAVHYMAPIVALNYFFIVSAICWCSWQNKRFGRLLTASVASLAALALVVSLDARTRIDDSLSWSTQRALLLAHFRRQDGQHLLVVHYHSNDSRHPVWEYNEADIDSAQVVWARGMDKQQNCKLMKYFNDRHVWSVEISGDQSKPNVTISRVDFCAWDVTLRRQQGKSVQSRCLETHIGCLCASASWYSKDHFILSLGWTCRDRIGVYYANRSALNARLMMPQIKSFFVTRIIPTAR